MKLAGSFSETTIEMITKYSRLEKQLITMRSYLVAAGNKVEWIEAIDAVLPEITILINFYISLDQNNDHTIDESAALADRFATKMDAMLDILPDPIRKILAHLI